jgi:L-aminopeptidase/D-esterase-like protein
VRSTPLQDAEAILSGAASTLPPDAMARLGGPTRHTTLSVLVVNVAFPRELLRQLGRQVHSSMARAIQPFHTPDDGDILFTATTAELPAGGIDSTAVGVIASELAWDAVLSSYEPHS